MKLYKIPPTPKEDGLISIDGEGKERFARLSWRDHTVCERMPLHFYKMGPSAQEMEARRVTMKLIRKMKRLCGAAPEQISEGV